jgi:hypothetical protein
MTMGKTKPAEPEKPQQWYGRYSTDGSESFEHGPYASSAEAVEKMSIGREIGESFEIGRLVPFVPHIDAQAMFERMISDNEEYNVPDDWPYHISPEDIAHLEARLDNVLHQWLEELGKTPTFGDITAIQTFDMVEDKQP